MFLETKLDFYSLQTETKRNMQVKHNMRFEIDHPHTISTLVLCVIPGDDPKKKQTVIFSSC